MSAGRGKRAGIMGQGTKAFVVAAFMAVVAISGSQGQARHLPLDNLPSQGPTAN